MTTDNDAKKKRLLGRYRRIQSAQLVGLTTPPRTFSARYSTEELVYADPELQAAIEAYRRRKLAQLAAELRDLGVELPPPTDNELEDEYKFLKSAKLCLAAKGDAPDAMTHVPHIAADYTYRVGDHQWVTDMLEAFREQRLLEIEEEWEIEEGLLGTFRRRKELQEQLEEIDAWRLRLTEALDQLKEMARRVAADEDED